jgi:hypothetical protein
MEARHPDAWARACADVGVTHKPKRPKKVSLDEIQNEAFTLEGMKRQLLIWIAVDDQVWFSGTFF